MQVMMLEVYVFYRVSKKGTEKNLIILFSVYREKNFKKYGRFKTDAGLKTEPLKKNTRIALMQYGYKDAILFNTVISFIVVACQYLPVFVRAA